MFNLFGSLFRKKPKFFLITFTALFLLLFVLVRLLLPINYPPRYGHYHYYLLARSLLHGRIDVTQSVSALIELNEKLEADYSKFDGKYYVPMGPLPSFFYILLFPLPFSYAQPLILLVSFIGIVLLLRTLFKIYIKNNDLAFFYSVATLYSSPVSTLLFFSGPWYTAGVIGTLFSFLFLFFYKVRKKMWSILFVIPMALARPPLLLYFVLPLLDLFFPLRRFRLFKSLARNRRLLIYLLIACSSVCLLYFVYNYSRFGNPLEFGYNYQIFTDPFQKTRDTYGRFSFKYLVNNLIYLVLNPPLPYKDLSSRYTFPYFVLSRYGLGLFYIMPWFFIIFLDSLNREQKKLLVSAIIVALPSLLFSGEGSFQLGSRYANDFFPLLLFAFFPFLQKGKLNRKIYHRALIISLFVFWYAVFLVSNGNILRY